eukprot:scaffold65813_cov18-Tisochrysis_lutea.AAC.3
MAFPPSPPYFTLFPFSPFSSACSTSQSYKVCSLCPHFLIYSHLSIFCSTLQSYRRCSSCPPFRFHLKISILCLPYNVFLQCVPLTTVGTASAPGAAEGGARSSAHGQQADCTSAGPSGCPAPDGHAEE